MSGRALARLFAAWFAFTALAVAGVHLALTERPLAASLHVDSAWSEGVRRARGERRSEDPPAVAAPAGGVVVSETVVAEAWLPFARPLLAALVVPGRDGVVARLRGREARLTVDDLLAAGAYDVDGFVDGSGVPAGVDAELVVGRLAAALGTDARTLAREGTLARARQAPRPLPVPDGPLAPADARRAVRLLARHLAASADASGRFHYLVDAPRGRELGGYSLARHAGATYFLAQAAGALGDPDVAAGALRAAAWLREEGVGACGASRCVALAEEDDVALGSTALALLAFAELRLGDLDHGYGPASRALARTLRSSLRPDGHVVPRFRRSTGAPHDVPTLFVAGQVAFALARASAAYGDAEDLDAAEQALGGLAREIAARPFVSRWIVGEEHWTCLAAGELARARPASPGALAGLSTCRHWLDVQLRLQLDAGDTPFAADGAFSLSPFVTPRTTPAATRAEALGAELAANAAIPAGTSHETPSPTRAAALHRAVGWLARRVLYPEVHGHLFADPERASGAMPESEAQLLLRIDYAQHAGSAILGWLALEPALPGDECAHARTDCGESARDPWQRPASRLRSSFGWAPFE